MFNEYMFNENVFNSSSSRIKGIFTAILKAIHKYKTKLEAKH